ncbi:MAG: glutathione S-transferase, partial [Pseudomonadales bacterium]|nr:glutathione S-transferase [Pseudomonadales bacterium]
MQGCERIVSRVDGVVAGGLGPRRSRSQCQNGEREEGGSDCAASNVEYHKDIGRQPSLESVATIIHGRPRTTLASCAPGLETCVATNQKITLFHSPQTRSTSALALLEELSAPYTLHPLNMKAGEQRQSAFLAINPMGKVPAVLHGDALITEQGAITIYLADLFPEASITPALTDPLRGPYLRWLVFYGSCFEPALLDKAMKRDAGRQGTSPYGDYDTTVKTVVD